MALERESETGRVQFRHGLQKRKGGRFGRLCRARSISEDCLVAGARFELATFGL